MLGRVLGRIGGVDVEAGGGKNRFDSGSALLRCS